MPMGVAKIPKWTVPGDGVGIMPNLFPQQTAAVNHRPASGFVADHLHEVSRLINSHVGAIARFPIERDEIVILGLGKAQEILYLVGDGGAGGEMIRAPKETKGFRRFAPVVIFRILNGSALSGFVNDGDDASVLYLLKVDAVAMVDVDDGVDHI